MNEQKLFKTLQSLFANFNIDCCDESEVHEIYKEIDEAAGTSLADIYREEYMDEDKEEDGEE